MLCVIYNVCIHMLVCMRVCMCMLVLEDEAYNIFGLFFSFFFFNFYLLVATEYAFNIHSHNIHCTVNVKKDVIFWDCMCGDWGISFLGGPVLQQDWEFTYFFSLISASSSILVISFTVPRTCFYFAYLSSPYMMVLCTCIFSASFQLWYFSHGSNVLCIHYGLKKKKIIIFCV